MSELFDRNLYFALIISRARLPLGFHHSVPHAARRCDNHGVSHSNHLSEFITRWRLCTSRHEVLHRKDWNLSMSPSTSSSSTLWLFSFSGSWSTGWMTWCSCRTAGQRRRPWLWCCCRCCFLPPSGTACKKTLWSGRCWLRESWWVCVNKTFPQNNKIIVWLSFIYLLTPFL